MSGCLEGACAGSNRFIFTVVLMLPNATVASFPCTSKIVPTVFCPFSFTEAPSTNNACCSASRCACMAVCSSGDMAAFSCPFFLSFLRCWRSRNLSILRAILSSFACASCSCSCFRKSANSWRIFFVSSFFACASCSSRGMLYIFPPFLSFAPVWW